MDAGKKTFNEMQGIIEHDEKEYILYTNYLSLLNKYDEQFYQIDKMKEELEELKCVELPAEPIKVADMLIDARETRINCMTEKEYERQIYDKQQLKQIAEHLLVYCNNSEVE